MTLEAIIDAHRHELIERDPDANKGSYGRLLIIAGSRGMAGAAYLAGLAAFRCGIGMVKYYGPEDNRYILQTLLPEAMYGSDEEELALSLHWSDYVIVGPGLSKDARARALVRHLFDEDIIPLIIKQKLVVIDADALNIIAEEGLEPGALSCVPSDGAASDTKVSRGTGRAPSNVVITPHVMEMLRLASDDTPGLTVSGIKADPSGTARGYSLLHNVTVVLKDAVTTVAEHDAVYTLDFGCAAMAKAGSGDVLCGFIAGTTAMLKGNVSDAVPLAVCLHGQAGCAAASASGPHSTLARDIANAAPQAISMTCAPRAARSPNS